MLVKVIDDVITLDSQKIMREIQREKNIEEDEPDTEEEKTLEEHDHNQELKKLEAFIQGSTTGGAVGSHRRLVLTQTSADICLIMFCLFDFPFRNPLMIFKKAKYISWLLQ